MYIAIDIGGTNTKIGISQNFNQFINIEKFPTPKTFQELVSTIHSILDKRNKCKIVAIGSAGFIDRKEKRIIYSPNIQYLNNKIAKAIIPHLKVDEILLENDASLAGLAEATQGEGKNYKRVAYITISTGVGGTLIIDKKIPDTKLNFEPGHHIINLTSDLGQGEIHRSWESYSSGISFRKNYGVNPEDYNDQRIWDEYGKTLAIGLYNISLLWRPDVIVLGGSMSKKSHLFLGKTIELLQNLNPYSTPDIKISQLGDHNGIIGGLELIKNSYKEV